MEVERHFTPEQQQREMTQFRECVVTVVRLLFPALVRFAQKQVQVTQDTAHLHRLLINLTRTQSMVEADYYLLNCDEEENPWSTWERAHRSDGFVEETFIYQHLFAAGRIKGREQMRRRLEEERQLAQKEEGYQIEVNWFRETIIAVVRQRFPILVRATQKQVQLAQDTKCLQRLLLNLTSTHNVTEAEHFLLHFDDEESAG